jgi:hypothetical protein
MTEEEIEKLAEDHLIELEAIAYAIAPKISHLHPYDIATVVDWAVRFAALDNPDIDNGTFFGGLQCCARKSPAKNGPHLKLVT